MAWLGTSDYDPQIAACPSGKSANQLSERSEGTLIAGWSEAGDATPRRGRLGNQAISRVITRVMPCSKWLSFMTLIALD